MTRTRPRAWGFGLAACAAGVLLCVVGVQAQRGGGRQGPPGGGPFAQVTPLSDIEGDIAVLRLIRQLDLPRADLLKIAEVLDGYAAVQAGTEASIASLADALRPTMDDLRETLLRNVEADGGATASIAEFHQQVRDLRAQESERRSEAVQAVSEIVWGPQTAGLEEPTPPGPQTGPQGQGATPPERPAGVQGFGGGQLPLMGMIMIARRADDANYERRKATIIDRAAGMVGEGADVDAFRAEFGALLDEVRAVPDAQRRQAWPAVAERATALAAQYGIEVAPPETPRDTGQGGPPLVAGGGAPGRFGDFAGGPWRGVSGGLERLLLGDASRTASLLRMYAQNLVEE